MKSQTVAVCLAAMVASGVAWAQAPSATAPLPPAEVAAAGAGTPAVTVRPLRKLGGAGGLASWQGMAPADLEGKSIYNDVGAFLGKVEDVLGNDEQQITGLTVQNGGLLGLGGEKVIIPIEQVSPHKDPDALLTRLAKTDLETLPKWSGE